MRRTKLHLKHPAFLVFLTFSSITSQLWAQETQKEKEPSPESVIRVYTDLVQTDVMVFDKTGNFVNGLKREVFELRIDGKVQPIEFFDSVAAGTASEEAQLSAARRTASTDSTAPLPLDRGRTIFFYVDDFHLSAGDLAFLRPALLRFIDDDLGQNDEAVITSASGQIGFLQQLTDNKAVLRAALARINARAYQVQDRERPLMTEYQALSIDSNPTTTSISGQGFADLLTYFVNATMADTGETREAAEVHVRDRARTTLQQAASITARALDALEGLVHSSSQLPGRKLVFFVSSGFFMDPRNSDVTDRLQKITKTAAGSGVVIYSLDARGLATGLPTAADEIEVDASGTLARETTNELSASRDAMAKLALETGGRTIFDTNATEKALANAVRETSRYYLLAWRSNHETQTNKRARIEVSVLNHPELKVRLRQGFQLTTANNSQPVTTKEKSDQAKPPERRLRDALLAVYPRKELPVALDLQYKHTSDNRILLTASMQVLMDSVLSAVQDAKEKVLVDLGGFVYDKQGKVIGNFHQQGSAAKSGSADDPLTFNYELPVPPGLYQVRVGARDVKSGRMGIVHEWIEIPDLTGHKLALSTLLAGERQSASQERKSQMPRILMRADHHFHRDSSLRFQVDIYNASVAPSDAKPDLVMQLQAVRDRQPVITMPMRSILTNVPKSNEIRIGGEFPLKEFAPGRYLLLITVIDRLAKASASQQMRFEID